MTTGAATRLRQARAVMDTVVSIELAAQCAPVAELEIVDRAIGWFAVVESACSRFDASSEAMRLCATVGAPVRVAPILFEAVRFAVAVARLSDGAFDPTIGGPMETRGFNRNYRTGLRVATPLPPTRASYRDIQVDETEHTVTLHRPLVLDLGAVAKGLAIDLAARELACAGSYAIDAGGDIFVSGQRHDGSSWRVGVRHPDQPDALWCILQPGDGAICTSGGYARRIDPLEHHLLDPQTGRSPRQLVSSTVVAPSAMLADALSTAAFVLGPQRGLSLLARQGVEGLLLDRQMSPRMTNGFRRIVVERAA
jgi:thiamine biosynthesis lipoprotein